MESMSCAWLGNPYRVVSATGHPCHHGTGRRRACGLYPAPAITNIERKLKNNWILSFQFQYFTFWFYFEETASCSSIIYTMTGDRDCFCTYHIIDVTKLQMTDNESRLLLHSQSTDLPFNPYVFLHKPAQIIRVV